MTSFFFFKLKFWIHLFKNYKTLWLIFLHINLWHLQQKLLQKRLVQKRERYMHRSFVNSCCCCCEVTSVVSESVRPHRPQPTRLPRPWDSPGKNTGVGCHFLLQCMKVKSESEFAQSCPTLGDPMDCSPPGSSVHGIFQARVLESGAT